MWNISTCIKERYLSINLENNQNYNSKSSLLSTGALPSISSIIFTGTTSKHVFFSDFWDIGLFLTGSFTISFGPTALSPFTGFWWQAENTRLSDWVRLCMPSNALPLYSPLKPPPNPIQELCFYTTGTTKVCGVSLVFYQYGSVTKNPCFYKQH